MCDMCVRFRYVKADPPFIGIGLDISDSGREGCAVSTITITSQPAHWKGAVKVCGMCETQWGSVRSSGEV